ncbi:MAG: hypothetical protein OEV08_06710 [Nitrospira sp.]|nr:hypothetical protein [Nitrospira sp.]
MRPLTGILLVMILNLGTGCSHWIELTESPGITPSPSITVATDDRVPLLLETIHVSLNGSSIAPPAPLERQVLGAIEATRLFSQHYQAGYAQLPGNQAHVTVRLSINNVVDPHAGQAAWRGFVIGASMFTLSPFISLQYDYGTEMSLELERWDGHIKHYSATSNGTAHYNLFGASPVVIEQLKGQVTEACLLSLLDQVIQDATFYLAGFPQSQRHPTRTVSVNARHSPNHAIPISQPRTKITPQ